jgi:hypothetical protein
MTAKEIDDYLAVLPASIVARLIEVRMKQLGL